MDDHRIHDLKYSELMTNQDYALLAWVQYIYIFRNPSMSVSPFLVAKEKKSPSDLESHG